MQKSVKLLQVYKDNPQKPKASIILNVEGLDTFNIKNKGIISQQRIQCPNVSLCQCNNKRKT